MRSQISITALISDIDPNWGAEWHFPDIQAIGQFEPEATVSPYSADHNARLDLHPWNLQADTGCKFSTSCLSCPRPRCRYDSRRKR